MNAALQIVLALGSVAVLLGLMAVVRHFAKIREIRPEMQRKMVHIGTGLYAIALPWLFPDRWPVYLLVVLTLVVMLVLRLPNSQLGGTLHKVGRHSYGDLLLAVSVGLCLFMAGDNLYLYVLPIAVLTLADAAAALAGSTYGTRFYSVEAGEKSIEGSIVFFAVTLLISVMCLMVMTPFPPLNIIIVSLMVAAFGTLVEAASWRGFDNLFLPVGLLIFLKVHAASPIPHLVSLVSLFVISIVAFKVIAPKIGLTNHAARVYVIAVFLLLAETRVPNALVPVLVLAAHAWCRTAAPCKGKFPDLDIVAGLALVSFGWLTLGNATGWNAVSFYGMTAMGMMVGLCAIALAPQKIVTRIGAICGIVLVACALRALAIDLNSEVKNWNGPMWSSVFACLTVTIILPSVFPQAFGQSRVTKVTLLALAIPLTTYLYALYFSGLSI